MGRLAGVCQNPLSDAALGRLAGLRGLTRATHTSHQVRKEREVNGIE